MPHKPSTQNTHHQSLYSLKTVSPEDTTHAMIRTVNFSLSTKGSNNKIKKQRRALLTTTSEKIAPFFDHYHTHLQYLYDFAKELKIQHNISFKTEGGGISQKYHDYLAGKNIVLPPLDGSQFEVLGAKVQETIASIEKNNFILNFIGFLQKQIIKNKHGEEVFDDRKDTEVKKLLETEEYTYEDIQHIDLKALFDGLHYENVSRAQNLIQILQQAQVFDIQGELSHTKSTLISKLSEFNTAVQACLQEPFTDALQAIKPIGRSRSLVHSYAYAFYFSFDAKVREVEDAYFADINTLYNTLLQGLPYSLPSDFDSRAWYGALFEYKCINITTKKPEDIIQTLDILYDTINSKLEQVSSTQASGTAQNETRTELKDYIENLFNPQSEQYYQNIKGIQKSLFEEKPTFQSFIHPKSAPSFPGSKKKTNIWQDSFALSHTFDMWYSTYSPLHLFDYAMHRLSHKIYGSEPYKIYSYIMREVFKQNSPVTEFDILQAYVSSNNAHEFAQNTGWNFALDNTTLDAYLQQTNTKITHTIKTLQSKKHGKPRTFAVYTFTNAYHNYVFKPIQFEITQHTAYENNTLSRYLTQQLIQTLFPKDNQPDEYTVLKQILSTCDTHSLDTYRTCIESDTKLSRQTAKRIKELQKYPLFSSLTFHENVLHTFKCMLISLEHDLTLTNTFHIDEYTLAQPKLLKLYSSCGVLMSQAINTSTTQGDEYAKLLHQIIFMIRRLGLITDQSVSCKMNRMTHRTSGDSTLVFGYNPETQTVDYSLGYILATPVKIKAGQTVRFFESIEKAQKEFVKDSKLDTPQYLPRIFVGFLNGSKEVGFEKKINYVYDKEGNKVSSGNTPKNEKEKLDLAQKGVGLLANGEIPKYYTTYCNWTLSQFGVTYPDTARGDKEPVKGSSPAGYPKLYYILIPHNCQSLFFPVHVSTYYLKKYTPYMEIERYITLEKKAMNSVESALDFLQMRASLRRKNTISSIEIVLQKQYHEHIKKLLYTASAHMQFGISYQSTCEYDDDKGSLEQKKYYSLNEFKHKFTRVIGVDLGEKHLATIAIIPISKPHAEPYKTYLPLLNNDTDERVSFNRFVTSVLAQQPMTVDATQDSAYMRHDLIKIHYKNAQKQLGITPIQVRNKKKNFTEYVVESISTQLVKLAHELKGYIVFENLDTGVGSRKLERTVMTEIQKQTAKKLGECGLLLNSKYLLDDIGRITKGVFFDTKTETKSYTLSGMSRINPFMTSQRCSECAFTPFYFKQAKEFFVSLIKDEKRWKKEWQETGNMVIHLTDDESYIIIQEHKIHDTTKVSVAISRAGRDPHTLSDSILQRKVYTTKQYNAITTTVEELLLSSLYKKGSDERKLKASFGSILKKHVMQCRIKRDRFTCVCCGYEDDADYNAARNIALLFILSL